MKVFTFYYDRFDTATTSLALSENKINHYVLCHDNAEKFSCIGKTGKLIQTNEPKGIQNNFNYALDMLEPNEWGIFMSDDYKYSKKFSASVSKYGKYVKCDMAYVLGQLVGTINSFDKLGFKLIGFVAYDNDTTYKKRYSKYGLVDGRAFAIKKTDFRYHKQITTIPDYYATAWHLNKYGANLIINYCMMDFKRYTKDGMGSEDSRLEAKIKEVALLKTMYPNMLRISNKKGTPYGSHVIFFKPTRSK